MSSVVARACPAPLSASDHLHLTRVACGIAPDGIVFISAHEIAGQQGFAAGSLNAPAHLVQIRGTDATPIGRPSRISVEKLPAYAANARRTAADSICSAAGVNCEPITNPMRRNVMRATGSQNAVETPSANIAIVRCSSESRSVQEMPSTMHLSSSLPRTKMRL